MAFAAIWRGSQPALATGTPPQPDCPATLNNLNELSHHLNPNKNQKPEASNGRRSAAA